MPVSATTLIASRLPFEPDGADLLAEREWFAVISAALIAVREALPVMAEPEKAVSATLPRVSAALPVVSPSEMTGSAIEVTMNVTLSTPKNGTNGDSAMKMRLRADATTRTALYSVTR